MSYLDTKRLTLREVNTLGNFLLDQTKAQERPGTKRIV